MQQIQTILYASTACHELSLAEIDEFIAHCQRTNFMHGVSGVLVYSGGHYMGYLEGSTASVTRLFERIKADPRHAGVIEILRGTRAVRLFSEWSMAYRTENAAALSDPSQRSWFPSSELVESEGVDGAPFILRAFWTVGAIPRPVRC